MRKRLIFIMPIVILGLISFSCTTHMSNSSGSRSKAPSWSQAVYCNVESVQVCAVAQNEDECKKLGGTKVSTCTNP